MATLQANILITWLSVFFVSGGWIWMDLHPEKITAIVG